MKNIVPIIILLFVFSCNKTVSIEGFNGKAWSHDKNGCEGIRNSMKDELIAIKEQLKALSTDEIIAVLGRPDKTKLGERNQKYFVYSISPNEHCENFSTDQKVYLSIRFNATGYSYEVLVI